MDREELALAHLLSSYEQVAKCVYDHSHEQGTRVVEVRRLDMLVEGGAHEVYLDTYLNSYFPNSMDTCNTI